MAEVPVEMSLRHGLLGLLAEAPASGYDLTRRFAEVLGPVWPARHPQIYAELTRLADEGLIEVASRGPRGRTAYRITDAGLAEVRRWLAHTETDHTLLVSENSGVMSGLIHTHWQPSLLHAGGEGFVSALFVHPEYRGQGIGQALLGHVVEEA